jgi:hypothetical protein
MIAFPTPPRPPAEQRPHLIYGFFLYYKLVFKDREPSRSSWLFSRTHPLASHYVPEVYGAGYETNLARSKRSSLPCCICMHLQKSTFHFYNSKFGCGRGKPVLEDGQRYSNLVSECISHMNNAHLGEGTPFSGLSRGYKKTTPNRSSRLLVHAQLVLRVGR